MAAARAADPFAVSAGSSGRDTLQHPFGPSTSRRPRRQHETFERRSRCCNASKFLSTDCQTGMPSDSGTVGSSTPLPRASSRTGRPTAGQQAQDGPRSGKWLERNRRLSDPDMCVDRIRRQGQEVQTPAENRKGLRSGSSTLTNIVYSDLWIKVRSSTQ